MRILSAGVLTLCALFPVPSLAQSAHDVIRGLSKQIYVEGETNGGTAATWTDFETQAVVALRDIAVHTPESLISIDKQGRTPLIRAAANGFEPLVAVLLESALVLATLSRTDTNGLDAYDHTLLSVRTTLQACHPEIQNPFVLVPFLVSLSYYKDRQPYVRIAAQLAASGADREEATAKASWLEMCSTKSATHRALVTSSTGLLATLADIQTEVEMQQRRKDVEENVEFLRMLYAPMIKSGKHTQKDLDQAIADLYRENGLHPPKTDTPR